MRIQSYFCLLLIVLVASVVNSAYSQIYSAKEGSFIVFHPTPNKSAVVKFVTPAQSGVYQWPSGVNDFIISYREAEKLFFVSLTITDENLQKLWESIDENPLFGRSHQIAAPLLLALGQAAFIPGDNSIKKCEISIRIGKESETTKILEWRDHISSVVTESKAEKVQDNGRSSQLKYVFPKDSWIAGARIFKKTVGDVEDREIFPIVYITSFTDHIEMGVRDTMKEVGEFLYTIQPKDQLKNLHPNLEPIYVQNYNDLTEPSIVNFRSEAIKESKFVRLAWSSTVPQRIRGFEIYRSPHFDSPFVRIASLPATDSVYVDQVEGVMSNYYYFVQIIDQFGPGKKSIVHFVVPIDNEKPAPPFDLVSNPVINGVKLQWPVMDGLHHVRGYYVFRIDRDNVNWTQVSEFIPRQGSVMTFIDSASMLEAHQTYTYAVKSESTSYQLSDLSTQTVCRPGKPRNVITPGDFSFRYMDDGKLMLYWSDQTKLDPYISKYHIYATDQNGKLPVEVKGSPFDVTQNFWIVEDGTVIAPGYIIRSADAWKNMSTASRMISPLEDKKILSPGFILVHPSKTGHRLSWGLPESPDVKSIQLYEQAEDGKSTLVQSLKPSVGQYDLAVSTKSNARILYLKWKLANGTETEPGEAVVITK